MVLSAFGLTGSMGELLMDDTKLAIPGACSVVIASTAEMKVGAVKRLLGEGFTVAGGTVEGVKAASEINEQPFGHEETLRGALNRLANARKLRPEASYYVAIENGIFEVVAHGPRFFDLAWVVVETGAGQQALAHSVGLEFPREFVEQARAVGFDKTHAGEKLAAAIAGVHLQDPHHWLSGRRLCREDLLLGALIAAWGQLHRQPGVGS